MAKALKINPADNVAVVLANVRTGEEIEVTAEGGAIRLEARQAVAFGHKVALSDLEPDQPIIKYGEEIGRAQTRIAAGDWIHLHNLTCRRGHDGQA
ncbi:MAG: UxaA family hydrolase [Deltaproteobacteria bacterium]|nr:UxaA family hydrolase [Deltaproteobacteria bacterium]